MIYMILVCLGLVGVLRMVPTGDSGCCRTECMLETARKLH